MPLGLWKSKWELLREDMARRDADWREERAGAEEKWNDYQKEVIYDLDLPENIVDGPWDSKESYIGSHYQILREDAIAPLRLSVELVKANPGMDDDETTCVYTHAST